MEYSISEDLGFSDEEIVQLMSNENILIVSSDVERKVVIEAAV